MRILFMGTPEFARESLRAMVEDGREVVCVITQPDKPKGRGYETAMPEVKKYALEHNIDVYQPQTLKDNAISDILEKYRPDIIIVVAYGKLRRNMFLTIRNTAASTFTGRCFRNTAAQRRFSAL